MGVEVLQKCGDWPDFSGIWSAVVSRVSIGSKRKPSVPRMKMWV